MRTAFVREMEFLITYPFFSTLYTLFPPVYKMGFYIWEDKGKKCTFAYTNLEKFAKD